MDSLDILFLAKDTVDVQQQPVPAVQPGEILVRLQRSLISTGTECICLQRNFAPGSHWDTWVKYPFRPGYSAVVVVEAVMEASQPTSSKQPMSHCRRRPGCTARQARTVRSR